MGSNLIGDDTRAHILLIGQGQVFFGGDIAEHSRSQPCDLCTTDGTGNMIVARCDIGDDRSKGVEGRFVTVGQLALHILLYLMHRHMTRTFDESLHVLVPGTGDKLAHGVELSKLGGIIGVGRTTGT